MVTDIKFIGDSKLIREIKQKLPLLSACDATILITGDTGTGKEILARTVHRLSHRKEKAFVTVNCGGVPKDLIENELFGHKRGAYTQAFESTSGLVGVASGGTLFLDEIDSLPLEAQPKLLRLLQEKEYRIIGDHRLQRVDLRFIAATVTNLEACVRERSFRADLFYRLNIFHLHLPLLKERKEDIPALATHFIQHFGNIYQKKSIKISDGAVNLLMSYDWPGNIRELEHAIHRAVVSSHDKVLNPGHFDLPATRAETDFMNFNQPYHHIREKIISDFEVKYISRLLEKHQGNVTSAARAARLDRRTFQRLMNKHGISRLKED
ncbi:MAG: sigma 54-interacting transcriptional regulator [Candidatus Hodarchaeota archaeon]